MFSVYGMVDPRNKSYFYVGCTSRCLLKRWNEHVFGALRDNAPMTIKNRRIQDIVGSGFSPDIEKLEYVESERLWREREVYWIRKLVHEGHRLANNQWNKYMCIHWQHR